MTGELSSRSRRRSGILLVPLLALACSSSSSSSPSPSQTSTSSSGTPSPAVEVADCSKGPTYAAFTTDETDGAGVLASVSSVTVTTTSIDVIVGPVDSPSYTIHLDLTSPAVKGKAVPATGKLVVREIGKGDLCLGVGTTVELVDSLAPDGVAGRIDSRSVTRVERGAACPGVSPYALSACWDKRP